jgi:hypothetical protein
MIGAVTNNPEKVADFGKVMVPGMDAGAKSRFKVKQFRLRATRGSKARACSNAANPAFYYLMSFARAR